MEKREIKLPAHIPEAAVLTIRDESDVDELPRGAIAHLESWDEDLALDLMVAGAAITLIDRTTYDDLQGHEDFDPEGFGILDEDGLWLPGLSKPYTRSDGGWDAPDLSEEE